MATHVVQFSKLSARDRKATSPLPKRAAGDRVELRVRNKSGKEQTLALPASAADAVEVLLTRLVSGERVVVLSEEQELSPAEASAVLGVSRPLVVLRMDKGDLPFRYVGTHRRARLADVLALKRKIEARQTALDALAEDTERLMRDHAL